MTTLGTTVYTLADLGKMMDPNGKPAAVIDLMTRTNLILEDMLWKEGNLPTGHRVTVRDGLPTSYFRMFSQGVSASKATGRQVDEKCGLMTSLMSVDQKLAELNGMKSAFMVGQAKAYIESMNQLLATTLFYGDSRLDPEKFHGLDPRFAYSDAPNVINFGDSGSACTSIWLIGWGENTVHMTYPKGSSAGLDITDMGLTTATDSDSKKYPAYEVFYQWQPGLVVEDWRYVVRIANIDTTSFTSDSFSDAMVDAYNLIPNTNGVKLAWYCNRTIKGAFDKEAKNSSNAYYNINKVFGKPQTEFWEIPVRRCDAILNTETAKTATP